MRILQVKASMFSDNGASSRFVDQFVARLREQAPFLAKREARAEEQRQIVAYSDALIDELRGADVLVLGLPMYNFGVPSQLKAWFDHVEKTYVFATRGGVYGGDKHAQTQFVRQFLEFIGIADIEFVYAEGLATGAEQRNNSLARARAEANRLALTTRLAA